MNRVYLSLCIALLLILTCLTIARNTVWQDELSSWGDIVSKNPNKPRGYNSLGLAYAGLGKFDKALALYEQAIYL